MQAKIFLVSALLAMAVAQDYQDYDIGAPRRPAPARIQPGISGPAQPKPTPVPILKQINRHNEDGSYTYGYESADGAFKIETKAPNGEVKGKYGFVDDQGKVRVVEYGANMYGFQPAGEGITVAPPTLVDETTGKDALLNQNYDDGQYYEQPIAPVRAQPVARPRPRPVQQQYAQDTFTSTQQFAGVPQASPVPSRAVIAGAAPVGDAGFGPRPQLARPQPAPARSFAPAPLRPSAPLRFEPAPVEEDNTAYAPAPVAAPRPQYAQAAPIRSANQYARPSSGGSGLLDQLARDYALPQDAAAPLHDISFGYY